MKRAGLSGSIALLIGLMFFIIVAPGYGKEFFMYDAENNQIMEMASTANTFTPKLTLDKLPDRIMATDTPDNFIALYLPDMEKRKPNLIESLLNIQVTESKALNTGRIILWNTKTERTTDLVDFGYPPYSWTYTKDRKHLFISYRPSQSEETTELLHYFVPEKTSEKILLPIRSVNNLALSFDETQLYILGDDKPRQPKKGNPLRDALFRSKKRIDQGKEFNAQMITMSIGPLETKTSLAVENLPVKIINISKERSVLINQDWTFYSQGGIITRGFGSIKLIDTLENKVIMEKQLTPSQIYTQWLEDEKTLIVACNDYSISMVNKNAHLNGKGYFFKITENEINASPITSAWTNFDYYPDTDQLFMLSQKTLEIVNFTDNSLKKVKIKFLPIMPYRPFFENHLYRIPGSDIGIIYSHYDVFIQFYDFNKGKIVDDMKTGRLMARLWADWRNKAAKTIVNTNEDQSHIYIFSAYSGDITVLDRELKKTGYIVLNDKLEDVYQIKKPAWNTLVATEKALYRLDYAQTALALIHEFSGKIDDIAFIEDDNRLLVITDRDLLVLDMETLAISQSIPLFGEPGQTYTKLKKGEQRYYFVNNL